MNDQFEPKILAFLCNWCAYAGADLAGVSRLQYPPTIRTIRVMCSGRVDPEFVVNGFKSGFDGVFVSGWHFGECHYLDGNVYAEKRIQLVGDLLELAGIGRERLQLRWVSAAEGQLFAEYVTQITEQMRELGPFDRSVHELALAALEQTLAAPRMRWLLGCTRQLTERENVYGDRLEAEGYAEQVKAVAAEEYEKALVAQCLKAGPKSVKAVAAEIGMPVYTVSQRLNELERAGQAGLSGYEGRTPQFVAMAA